MNTQSESISNEHMYSREGEGKAGVQYSCGSVSIKTMQNCLAASCITQSNNSWNIQI